MPSRQDRIFIDTCAIQAAHRYRCWNALCKGFRLETVEHCLHEAVRLDRKGRKLVDRPVEDIRQEIVVHVVTDEHRARLAYALQGRVDLDDGERDLLAIALTIESEAWWLCGPDMATIRAMNLLGRMERMVSLQSLANELGMDLRQLDEKDTDKWLSQKRTLLLMEQM